VKQDFAADHFQSAWAVQASGICAQRPVNTTYARACK
jgi:hypothetical protein